MLPPRDRISIYRDSPIATPSNSSSLYLPILPLRCHHRDYEALIENSLVCTERQEWSGWMLPPACRDNSGIIGFRVPARTSPISVPPAFVLRLLLRRRVERNRTRRCLEHEERRGAVASIGDQMRAARPDGIGLPRCQAHFFFGFAGEDTNFSSHDVKRVLYLVVIVPWHCLGRAYLHLSERLKRIKERAARRPR